MKITAHKLKDRRFTNWHDTVEDRWDYEDMLKDPDWRRDWISFDCCLYVPEKNEVCCGVTSFEGEIFWIYDCASGKFRDPGYASIRDPYDAKFHRSLVRHNSDGSIYGAIALLHDIDRYWDAPGGAIVRYDPSSGSLQKVCIPLPHVYIQSICLDQEREVIYGTTFTPERMFRFDLKTGFADDLGPISSGFQFTQAECLAIDDQGCVWSPWTATRAWQNTPGPDCQRLLKFDPAAGKTRYFKTGLPRADGSYGYEKLDCLFNLGTGDLFASGGNGSCYRIDTESGVARLLFSPIKDRPSRLSSLCVGPDGAAYGVTGRDGECQVIRIDPRKETYELLATVADGEERCWQIHNVSFGCQNVLYACENDNPHRSSYLWEIRL